MVIPASVLLFEIDRIAAYFMSTGLMGGRTTLRFELHFGRTMCMQFRAVASRGRYTKVINVRELVNSENILREQALGGALQLLQYSPEL